MPETQFAIFTHENGLRTFTSGAVVPEGAVVVSEAAWRDAANKAIASAAQLGAFPPLPAMDDLLRYAQDRRYAAETGGVVLGGIPFATDDRAKTMLLGARLAAQSDAGFTTTWIAADGSAHTLTASDIVGISNGVQGHVARVFAAYAALAAGIKASPPTVISYAAIDAAFADI